jgi:hypothetical protein
MFLFLPETSSPNILLRRAKRIRKLTGNSRFMSQSEIDQRNMKFSHTVVDALIKPMEITLKDPAVLFVQVYTAIIYGIYYSCKTLLSELKHPFSQDEFSIWEAEAEALTQKQTSLRSLSPRLPSLLRLQHG